MKAKKILLCILAVGMLFTLPMVNAVNANEVDEEENIEEILNEEQEQKETIEKEGIEKDDTSEIKEPEEVNTDEEKEHNEKPVAKQKSLIQATAETNELVADQTTLAEAFPDLEFRRWVYEVALEYGAGTYNDDVHKVVTMSQSEIDSKIKGRTASINVSSKGISSLSGIEYFTNITTLQANSNQLTGTLDLTNLANLKTVQVHTNKLEKLDISGLEKLTTLHAYTNTLTELNLSDNNSLNVLKVQANKLTSINLTEATNITELQIQANELESIDLSQNSKLKIINISANKITGSLNLTHMDDLTSLQAQTNKLEKLDIWGLEKLTTLHAYTNTLTELNLSDVNSLNILKVQSNKLTSIDLTEATNITELQIQANELESIDLSQNSKLKIINISANKITGNLSFTHMDDLTSLQAQTNKLEKLDISGLEKLTTLLVYTNTLTELNLSDNNSLNILKVQANKLTSIDLTEATNITELQIQVNELESIDLSQNSKLKIINISSNELTGSLNLTHMDDLTSLQVYNTKLNQVNIAGLVNLKTLYSYYNPQLTIDLSGINSLTNLSVSKAINANLETVTSFYVTGSKSDGSSIVRLSTTEDNSFSWNATTGYYVVAANKGAQYAVGLPKYDEEGNFAGLATSSYTDISDGALMDEEGNLIIGATLDDVSDDGTISLDKGIIITGDGVYDFSNEFSMKDGEITTKDDYSFSKNIINEDSVAVVGGETITITVPDNGIAIVDTVTPSASLPTGSTITNNEGDKTYTTGPSNVDKDGNVDSDDYTITVPADKVAEVKPDGNGNTILPDGSTIKDKDGNTVNYPGKISVDEDGSINLLPIENITQEELDEIQKELDKFTDEGLKDKLQEQVDEVQDQLNRKALEDEAKNAVNKLIDENENIKDGVTQTDIKNTQKVVDKLPAGELRNQLQTLINKVQTQLDKKTQESKAQDSVQTLFNEDGTIKEDVTQIDITNAQKEVEKLSSGELKNKLQTQINKAQKQFDERDFTVLETFEVFTGSGSISTRINAPVEKFSKVYVNGAELITSNYVVSEGSTIITLNEAYLKTLANGLYNVEIEFKSGAKISVPLTVNVSSNPSKGSEDPKVEEPKKNPSITGASTTTVGEVNTGDTTDLTTLYAMAGISLLGMLLVVKRRKQEN